MNDIKPPRGIGDLRNRIIQLSKSSKIEMGRIQRELAHTVVTQMMPENSAIKGGSALALRYPTTETRLTEDLDITFKQSLDQFVKVFSNNLKTGWNGFTGNLVERGNPAKNTIMPGYFEMTPLNVKLQYLNDPFTTVKLDVTPEIFDEVESSILLDGVSNSDIFDILGLQKPNPAIAISIENQLAQKIQGLANPKIARPRDLIDIQFILRNEKYIDYDILNKCIIREFELNHREYPLNINQITDFNKVEYAKISTDYDNLKSFDDALQIVKDITDDAFMAN